MKSPNSNPNRCIECGEPSPGQSLYCKACMDARPDPKETQRRIKSMHETWQRECCQTIPLHAHRETRWAALILAGFGEDDVVQLARYLWKGIRDKNRRLESLKFDNFTDIDRFENDIALARMTKPADTSGRVPSRPTLPRAVEDDERLKPEDLRGLKSLIANMRSN